MTSEYNHLSDPDFPRRKPVDRVLFPNESDTAYAPSRPDFDPNAPVHQSSLNGDDLTDAIKATACNPHSVDKAVATQHVDASSLGYGDPVVKLQRSGPNCL